MVQSKKYVLPAVHLLRRSLIAWSNKESRGCKTDEAQITGAPYRWVGAVVAGKIGPLISATSQSPLDYTGLTLRTIIHCSCLSLESHLAGFI